MRNRLLTILASVTVLITVATPVAADNGGGVEATYSESNGCGIPRGFSALATRSGGLPDAEPIRGPVGAMFGRTVGQARAALVRWTVPFSGGLSVSVHNRALPAFAQAANNLAASGSFYSTRARETFAFTARTVSGSRSISYHAFGAAIDVNSGTNPTAADLITDMPPLVRQRLAAGGILLGRILDRRQGPHALLMDGSSRYPGIRTGPASLSFVGGPGSVQ